jgi:hemerythrin-like domain-containing protein
MTTLNNAPAVGFDQPFELLQACHDRVHRTLGLLLRLGEHLQTVGPDQQAQEAAADVLRYFDIAAPHHHEDEERHVLPRLRKLGQVDLADRLASEHRQMNAAYQAIRIELVALRDQAVCPTGAGWQAFADLYRAHIELEESSAYPPVRDKALAADLAKMGADMSERRQVRPEGASAPPP